MDRLRGAITTHLKRSDAVRSLGGPADPVDTISTGSSQLNEALGVGGWALGRIVEIFGPESGGKTTLALHAIAEAQAAGMEAVFVDAEHALNPAYATALGVNVDRLLLSQPDSGEDGLKVVEAAVKSTIPTIVVVDSVAALIPQSELDGEIGDATMGAQARMMGQAMRKITAFTKKNKCLVIFINQVRQKIGVVYGNPETTPGGGALKFFASQRVRITVVAKVKEGENGPIVGNRCKARVVKNKLAPPFRETEILIRFGHGLDAETEALDKALELGIITKTGATFFTCEEMGSVKLGVGRRAVVAALKDPAIGGPILHALETGELPMPNVVEAAS